MPMQISISNAIGGGGGNLGLTPTGFTNLLSTSFDGVDDYVTMGDVSSLSFERTDAFSISCWVARGTTGANHTLVSKMASTGNQRGYFLFISSGNKIRFFLRTDTSFTSQRLTAESASSITDTNWHHILVTYDGSSATSGINIYLDGVAESLTLTGTLSATIQNNNPFNIGARNNSINLANADIDEVSVFNTELSVSEVTTIYNSGVPNDLTGTSGLVSWWRMGDGDTFPTITDNQGSNNGTMTNMSSGNFITNVPT